MSGKGLNGPIPWSKVGAGAVGLLVALLSYLAAETRTDVRQIEKDNATRAEETADFRADIRAELRGLKAIMERIERKVGP
jgi:hypothetical protein